MGNKSDKENERKVTKEEGRQLALVSYKRYTKFKTHGL